MIQMGTCIFSSHFSIGRSILTCEKSELIDNQTTISIFSVAKQHGIEKIVLAEDSMSGFYEGYVNSVKEQKQLIFGLNFKIVNDVNIDDQSDSIITVWMKNSKGYEDILRLNSFANNEGYQHPNARIDWKTLNELVTNNLLITIPFYSSFLFNNLTKLGQNCLPLIENFNPIFFVSDHSLPFDATLKDIVVKFCEENYYDYLTTHNIYYYQDCHAESLQCMRCIQERSKFEKPELSHFSSNQFSLESYIRKYGENFNDKKFTQYFKPYQIDKLTRGVRIPEIVISPWQKESLALDKDADNYKYLCHLVAWGLKNKILYHPEKSKLYDDYVARCKIELDILKKTSLVDYILIVADVINFAREKDIPIGRSRGSVSGSLVCWLIGITEVDSLEYNLYFTRFISETRVKSVVIDGATYLTGGCADVDSDFSYLRRHEVISYVDNKYEGKIAKIGTVSTLTGKSVLQEVTKAVLNYSQAEAQYVSDMIERIFGKVEGLSDVYENNKAFQVWVDTSPLTRKAYNIARHLEGLIKNRGCHASGTALSYDNIDIIVPLVRGVNTDGEEYLATAYDMNAVGNILLKLDLLGLKSLDVIDETLKKIGKKDSDIDVHDEGIYNYLNTSELFHGLFQIESGIGKNVVSRIKPKNLDQLAVCISVNRPGALKFIDKYVEFNETGKMDSIYPSIDNILKDTGGVLVYQEQINQICQEVYQMKGTDAEEVRRAVSKKKKEDMAKWESVLQSQGKELGIPEEVTKYFWGVCDASADYLFSKNHAVPYSQITAIETYLKNYYSLEFYTAVLNMAAKRSDPSEQIGIVYRELQKVGIGLLPLSLQHSQTDFVIEGKNIRYGFAAAKGIGPAAVEKILSFNKNFKTKFELFNNCLEGGLDLRTCAALIQAGVFPTFGHTRAKLLLEFQTYKKLNEKERVIVNRFAEKFNNDLFAILKYLPENKGDDGKVYLKESRLNTIRKEYGNYKKIYDFNKQNDRILNYLMERAVLSYSYTGNLNDIFRVEYPELKSIHEAITDVTGAKNTVVGMIRKTRDKISKNKNAYLEIELIDDYSEMNFKIFNNKIQQFKNEKDKNPEEGTIIIIRGTNMGDGTYFGDWGKVLYGIKLAKRITDIKE